LRGKVASDGAAVLLLDEPVQLLTSATGSLSGWNSRIIWQALKLRLVYVTHNLSEAFVMSDRIAVKWGNGHIEQIGINTEIYDKPTSSYVAKFWESIRSKEKP